MTQKITKAVFPVAGLGSRFLPATKAQPKEMLPVVDKPLIQYAVEEAVAAGITELIFITGRHKRAIEDHFDTMPDLESHLADQGKSQLLFCVQNVIPSKVHCIFIRQPAPLGLGHAVLCARPVIGKEDFAVLLADDLMQPHAGHAPVLAQMLTLHQEKTSMLAVQNVARDLTVQYGIVSVMPEKAALQKISAIIEKPRPEHAPSTLAVSGRYILSHEIFTCLAALEPHAGQEIQLTDALSALLKKQAVFAYDYQGICYDCGSKIGYLKANIAMGLQHPDLENPLRAYLQTLL